jgi:UDP-N-acetylmuramoylalanine--D-glutamate ligase
VSGPAALAGRRVLVVGLGVSGAAAAAAAARAGAEVVATDAAGGEAVRARGRHLASLGVDVRLATDGPDLLTGSDLVVPSPGVAQSSPILGAALRAGVEVWSEPELAWRLSGGGTRLVAVTGTNGKTSTTELLGACLGAPSAGNIGTPLCDVLAVDRPPPLVVAELSSFQLRFASTLAPHVAVLLNVAPDHLDWHGDASAYADAKANVWARQGAQDWTVLNLDDPGTAALAERSPPRARVVGFTLGAPAPGQVGRRGAAIVSRIGEPAVEIPVPAGLGGAPHRLANALAASAAALCAGAGPAAVARGLARHRPGPHRLEVVAERGGVRWVNDSKATNPHAAAAALSSYERVVWIAGGLNKGLSFDPLADLLAERARYVITVGTAAPEIGELARRLALPVADAGTVAGAVALAAGVARPGDTVLLAPACASMDQFHDYSERGQAFRDAVAAVLRPDGEAPR